MANEHVWLDDGSTLTELRCCAHNGRIRLNLQADAHNISIDLTVDDIDALIAHLVAEKGKIPF